MELRGTLEFMQPELRILHKLKLKQSEGHHFALSPLTISEGSGVRTSSLMRSGSGQNRDGMLSS